MKATNVQAFQFDDPEAGSAVALLLAAVGYEVETDLNDGTFFVSADGERAEMPLIDEDAPERSVYNLACQLRERMERQADETELPALSSEYPNVA
jgi:hypothetical protein